MCQRRGVWPRGPVAVCKAGYSACGVNPLDIKLERRTGVLIDWQMVYKSPNRIWLFAIARTKKKERRTLTRSL
jgi:hypothetical protein